MTSLFKLQHANACKKLFNVMQGDNQYTTTWWVAYYVWYSRQDLAGLTVVNATGHLSKAGAATPCWLIQQYNYRSINQSSINQCCNCTKMAKEKPI